MADYTHSTTTSMPAVPTQAQQPLANTNMDYSQANAGIGGHAHDGHGGYDKEQGGARQIVHQSRHWSHGLFACFDDPIQCLTGCCFPCVVYGRKQQRLENPNVTNPEWINGNCITYGALAYFGCAFVLGFTGRQRQREQYGIDGSAAEDLLTACCCGCCALIQEEKEIDARYGHSVTY